MINDQGPDHFLVIPLWIHVERMWIEPVNHWHRPAPSGDRKEVST
jgi:hypothetical protein